MHFIVAAMVNRLYDFMRYEICLGLIRPDCSGGFAFYQHGAGLYERRDVWIRDKQRDVSQRHLSGPVMTDT